MRIATVVGLGSLLILGCSADADDDSGPKGCADISGNYDVKVAKVGGTCPSGGSNSVSLSIVKKGDGYSVYLPGIDGGCPGELDAATCKYTALCEISTGGSVVASYNLSYTFDGNAFSGSLVGTAGPPIFQEACDSSVKHDGTRI